MATPVKWRIKLEHLAACNCNWGCPCSFDALPTYGKCEAGAATRIIEGRYGDVSLAGLKWAMAATWPAAIHEGKGRAVAASLAVFNRPGDNSGTTMSSLSTRCGGRPAEH